MTTTDTRMPTAGERRASQIELLIAVEAFIPDAIETNIALRPEGVLDVHMLGDYEAAEELAGVFSLDRQPGRAYPLANGQIAVHWDWCTHDLVVTTVDLYPGRTHPDFTA